jgi:hypothetical protein
MGRWGDDEAAWTLEEGSRRPGGLVEEAEGGGRCPSPLADEELEMRGLSLAICTGGIVDWDTLSLNYRRLGCCATLIASFPSQRAAIFQIAAGDHGRSRPLFLPPSLASAR